MISVILSLSFIILTYQYLLVQARSDLRQDGQFLATLLATTAGRSEAGKLVPAQQLALKIANHLVDSYYLVFDKQGRVITTNMAEKFPVDSRFNEFFPSGRFGRWRQREGNFF